MEDSGADEGREVETLHFDGVVLAKFDRVHVRVLKILGYLDPDFALFGN